MIDFKAQYNDRINIIDDYMKKCLDENFKCESELFEAMEYAVFGSGKRLRSVLCIETAKMLTGNIEKALPFAAAIEFIHAFSLVHDDLPCMDNDDFRRGKPSCHKKYGEAMALLAGDALLNTAHELMALECEKSGLGAVRAMIHVAKSAGVHGMINGQVRDIKLSEEPNAGEDKLIALIEQKTMALIMTGIVSAAYLSEADEKTVFELEEFAYNLGIAFQIRDDFEDEEEDKQNEHNSPNFINVLGREAAMERMVYHKNKAKEIISKYENNDFILGFIEFLFG